MLWDCTCHGSEGLIAKIVLDKKKHLIQFPCQQVDHKFYQLTGEGQSEVKGLLIDMKRGSRSNDSSSEITFYLTLQSLQHKRGDKLEKL